MQLFCVATVLAAVLIVEAGESRAVDQSSLRIGLTVSACLCVVAFAFLGARSQSRWLKKSHALFWLVANGVILYPIQWPAVVRGNLGMDRWILIDELLIYLPMIVSLIASRVVLGRLREYSGSTKTVLVAARVESGWMLELRLLLAIVLPLSVVFAANDVVRMLTLPAVTHVLTILLMLLMIPWLLRICWRTTRLADGELRTRLTGAPLICRDFLVWNTNRRCATAMIAGVFARVRYIFVSDRLLGQLDEEQVEAIVLHEAGHVDRSHLIWRALMVLPPTLAAFACWRIVGVQSVALTLSYFTATTIFTILLLSWHFRLLEHDADFWAVEHLPPRSQRSTTDFYIDALDKLHSCNGLAKNQQTWLHPSFQQRAQMLRRVENDPAQVVAFRRKISAVSICVAVLTLAGVAANVLL